MNEENSYPEDVVAIKKDGKEYFVVGTAHISQHSADLVKKVIENEKPDCVCIELDAQRFKSLTEKNKWESLDLKTVIKEKQLTTLFVNIMMSAYQKKLGKKLGVKPGSEMIEAINTAKSLNIPIELCDREIRTTLRRAWNSMPLGQKFKLMTSGLAGLFEDQEISEEKLAEIKQKDVLSEMIDELGKSFPVIKKILIDERDKYLAEKIKNAKGNKIVAVVGAGHVKGICEQLKNNSDINLEELTIIPPSSNLIKIIGWGIPIIIIASIIYIGFDKGALAAGSSLIYWILATGLPCCAGAILSLAHPFTILAAFLAAPITSLTPIIGAAHVTAFVQAYFKPPLVKEIQEVAADFGKIKMWWKNRLLQIFLVFILTGIGSLIGTYFGTYKIISNLF